MGKLSIIIGVLAMLYILSFATSKVVDVDFADKIAIITIEGAILPDGAKIPFQNTGVSSETLIKFLDEADKSKDVKGIILEINSPGGAVVASKEVAERVAKIEKPVVALIKDMGASGAYWIAASTDSIIADRFSITGSIGVIAAYLEFSELFEKYGVTYESLKSGEYKDIGSPLKKLSNNERVVLQRKLDIIHEAFLDEVKTKRNLSEKQVNEIRTGVYFLGQEAKELGLVDMLGNKELAINITKEKAGIDEAKIIVYEKKETIFDLFTGLSASAAFFMGEGVASGLKKTEVNSVEILAR